MKVNSKGKFEIKSWFLKPLSQKFVSKSQSFGSPWSSTQKKFKKVQIVISCTNVDRKMKIKSKRNFQIRYSFMKLFSQNLDIQTPICDVIISILGQRDLMCMSCTTGG